MSGVVADNGGDAKSHRFAGLNGESLSFGEVDVAINGLKEVEVFSFGQRLDLEVDIGETQRFDFLSDRFFE